MPKLKHTEIAIAAHADGKQIRVRYGPALIHEQTITTTDEESALVIQRQINKIRHPEDLVWLGYWLREFGGIGAITVVTNAIIHGSY